MSKVGRSLMIKFDQDDGAQYPIVKDCVIAGAADPGKPCVIDVCRDLFHLDNDYVVAVQLPTPRFARGGLAHHGDPVKLLVVLFEIVVVQFTQSMIQAHDVAGQLQPVRIASYRLIAL